MIRYLKPSLLDRQYLSVRAYVATPISADLSKLVVTKPWGYEYLFLQHPVSEVWHLNIKHNQSTSMHCHPNKKTALVVLEGKALFSSLHESMELDPLDAVVIHPGTFHSTQAISLEDATVLELETPPMKHDLVRLEDKYGRAMSGYENIDKMILNGHHVRLSVGELGVQRKIGSNSLSVCDIQSPSDLLLLKTGKSIAILLSGTIESAEGETIHEAGDMLTEPLGPGAVCKNVVTLSITRTA